VDPEDGERALRRRLRAAGAAPRITRPEPVWNDWLNRALLDEAEVATAERVLRACGLPPHGDGPKNWDFLVALGSILERVPPSGRVLDAGALQYSMLLPWLFLSGYRRLEGIDLQFEQPFRAGPIRYSPMDLTRTTFAEGRFDAIACLSVIEHGVPFDAYLDEARRLLRPGGLLVTSTDYWCEPVDTGGQVAYGVPIRIFGPQDIERFVDTARVRGFRLVTPLALACGQPVVTWQKFGLHYTFINVVLERGA